MKHNLRVKHGATLVAAVLLSVFGPGLSNVSAGNDDTQHKTETAKTGHMHNKAGGHGGQVTMTKEFHFEVAFDRESVNVYIYDGKQNPVSAKGVSGTARIMFRGGDRKPLEVALAYAEPAGEHGDGGGHHEGQDYLRADVNMDEVQEGEAKAAFALKNLPGENEKDITFKETFKLARIVTYECPMSCVAPTDDPGNCPKCGMAMKRTETIYACSMHPNVTSRNPDDKCWVCGMKVSKVGGEDEESGDHHGH